MCSIGILPHEAANDPRPIVGPGASKDDVINAYGWPTGQAQAGSKEVLNYPQGQVTLSNGKVERVDFNMNIPWPAPRPRPGTQPTATKQPRAEELLDFWVTDYEAATKEAARRNARVLALFTGSDWSPASKRFLDEVAFHPDFVTAFTADFVFLRLDLPSRAPIDPALREQNNRLRERYGVTTYPAMLVLSPAGTRVGSVDLVKERAGPTYRDRAIEAVREVRDELIARPPPIDPAPAAGTAATAPAQPASGEAPSGSGRGIALENSMLTARRLVIAAVSAGGLLVALALWWLWRSGSSRAAPARSFAMSERIADAAGGLPSAATLAAWPREKLAAVIAGLAESDGYLALKRPPGGDADLVLSRSADAKPAVLVVCVAGQGIVPAKRVRELFASMTVEGVGAGWVVAPGGFAGDAVGFAADNGIALIDASRLQAQLRDLSPLLLQKVLTRNA